MGAYDIVLKRTAIADMDRLRKYDARTVADAMERRLQHEPRKESRSAVRRLRGISDPDYRLQVGDYRIFYNVDDQALRVDILRVMHKGETRAYYEEPES